MSEWISVKEKLPSDDQYVLVAMTTGYVTQACIYHSATQGDVFCDTDGETWIPLQDVSHWMPLPEPPKGEQP
jgi:hypothetical protein